MENLAEWGWHFVAGMIVMLVMIITIALIVDIVEVQKKKKEGEAEERKRRSGKAERKKNKVIAVEDIAKEQFAKWYQSGENRIHRLYESSIGNYMMTLILGDSIGIRVLFEKEIIFDGTDLEIEGAAAIAYREVVKHYNEYRGPARFVSRAIEIANQVGA